MLDNEKDDDEIVNLKEDQVIENVVDIEEDNSTPIEEPVKKAKKYGHLSKEEYETKYGTLEGYKTEEQFNKFGESYDEVKDLLKGMKKKIDKQERENESLVKYIENVREREYIRAKQDLDSQLRTAKEHGDLDGVEYLTKEQLKLDFQEAQTRVQQSTNQAQQALHDFNERNAHWYNVDQEMTAYAMNLDNDIRAGRYGQIPNTYDQLASEIEKQMSYKFPEKMGRTIPTQQRSAPSISAAKSATNKSYNLEDEDIRTFKSLSDDDKNVFVSVQRMMKKQGISYTEKDFIKKLKKDGEI